MATSWHGGSAAAVLTALILALLPSAWALPARIVGRQLVVDGKPLHLKGVCWNPVPKGGVHPKDLDFRGFAATDAELMARAGINAIRTYEAINDTKVLDILWEKKIHVLNTVYIWGKDPLTEIHKRVNAVKHHPAVLMWVVGNEWNYNGLYVGLPYPVALQRVKEAVKLIKENDQTHPVATVYGELPSPDTLTELKDVDAWGINKYSGLDFGGLFEKWASLSDAPMFLGEYGADAYNSRTSRIDEPDQAKATTILTNQIVKASSVHPGGVCIGGIIFEFADEWWKDGAGNPNQHDVGGVSPGGGPFPDLTFNEEWWGLVQYDGTPRQAYWAYARIEIPGQPSSAAQLQLALRGGVGDAGHKPRLKACGAHFGCRTQLGTCCPDEHGAYSGCCHATTTPGPTRAPQATTTWLPPASAEGGSSQSSGSEDGQRPCVADKYQEEPGMFANGHFQVGTLGCRGVGECAFLTRAAAQAFCSKHPRCTAVLLHPFEDDCAGGFGCYTPRYGEISENSLWDRSGGRAWARKKGTCKAQDSAVHHISLPAGQKPKYAFIGFYSAIEAQSACRSYGQLPMPKSQPELHELLQVLDTAQAANKLSHSWPKNTIWLGGQFNPTNKKWQWNDGTLMDETNTNWAAGQPSAAGTNQMTEPWLCMLLNGDMHDSSPEFDFGVICELGKSNTHTVGVVVPDGGAEAAAPAAHKASPPEAATATPAPSPPPKSTPAPPTPPPPVPPPVPQRSTFGRFEFAGFAGPTVAREACGRHMRPVMPKSPEDWHDLQEAIHAAVRAGKLSETWPHDTIWLGGKWSESHDRWEWDDGTEASGLNWAEGQPSAAKGHQDGEPWLCYVLTGEVHDSDPPFSFGVMCQDDVGDRPAGGVVNRVEVHTPAPASQRGMLDMVVSTSHRVNWVHGAHGLSCDEVCGETACAEGAWPGSAFEFREAVFGEISSASSSPGDRESCREVKVGGHAYDPSSASAAAATGEVCTWRGPRGAEEEERGGGGPRRPAVPRCLARPPAGVRRFCPCAAPERQGIPPPATFFS